ncbi:hypothetical protein SAMN03159463_05741 [Mesorhizobium sp. NFR06]|uniref:N,N-dimethylformamidase beta subunit family domain-containing protein n=1 Tax=Mesorhizobium sp. NFR06 TaxID=1566290 RepID=UPI0008E06D62|nr:N,N-dimethylformamidase beta subunit family domain-containing protein [Mesorhizobium sp. NFR06]SFQ13474.1 hypothetical protein SAMN03159463_05741 [Mesorhizobium sp. NFR06]
MSSLSPGRFAPNRGTTVHSQWPNAVFENFHELPLPDRSNLGAWCYTDRLSYAPGDRLNIHANTTGLHYDLRIYRDGPASTEVFAKVGIPGAFHKTPKDCSVNGCGWPAAVSFDLPSWQSGGYIVHIRGYDGADQHIDHHFPFAVRAAGPSAPNAILLITCTGTWMAYNDWGGSNHYEGIEGENADQMAPVVSTLRPFSRGFAWLPEGAPRITLSEPPKLGAAIRYPHMEWAYANGFSKKYASAGWATYERHFARWAEANGFVVDVATQHDLHAIPGLLDGYTCVALVGHDEYWSAEMRDNIEAYVDQGGHVARFAGNFTWQIRIEDDGTRQVCYKTQAEHADPVGNTDRAHLLTSAWDDAAVNRSGTQTFGIYGHGGIYAGWGGCVPRGSGGFTVYRPDHWAFAGTDLYYGDQLGAASKVFGYEVDGCDYTFRNGLPFATGSDGAPPEMEILAMNVATTFEADHGNAGSTFFMGGDDARSVAYQRLRRTDEEAIESVKRGSGMIVCFDRGKGQIFNAGSCEWVAGLIARDPFVEKLTRNVLERFTSQPTQP